MTKTPMLERLARALCKASAIDPDASYGVVTYGYEPPSGAVPLRRVMLCGRYEDGWDSADPKAEPRCPSGRLNWTWFEGDARAILTELREPSEGLTEVMRATYAPHFKDHPEFVEGWATSAIGNMRIMIDAIIEGKA